MDVKEKYLLLAIRSSIELGIYREGYNVYLLEKLADTNFSQKAKIEYELGNKALVLKLIDQYLVKHEEYYYKYDFYDIKQYGFEYIGDVSLKEIKEKIGIDQFEFRDNGDDQYFHLDEKYRFKVLIEKEVLDKVLTNSELKLFVSKDIVIDTNGYITIFYIGDDIDEDEEYYDPEFNQNDWLADAAGTDDPDVMNDVYWNLD